MEHGYGPAARQQRRPPPAFQSSGGSGGINHYAFELNYMAALQQQQQQKQQREQQQQLAANLQAQANAALNDYLYKPAAAPVSTLPAFQHVNPNQPTQYYTFANPTVHFYVDVQNAYQPQQQQPVQAQQQQQYAVNPQVYYYTPAVAAAPPAPVPASVATPAAVNPAPSANGTAEHPFEWRGNTRAEVDRQNAVIAQRIGADKQVPLMPANATNAQQWWCRELDGTLTLRNTNTIQEALQPGYWMIAPNGQPCWIRQPAV